MAHYYFRPDKSAYWENRPEHQFQNTKNRVNQVISIEKKLKDEFYRQLPWAVTNNFRAMGNIQPPAHAQNGNHAYGNGLYGIGNPRPGSSLALVGPAHYSGRGVYGDGSQAAAFDGIRRWARHAVKSRTKGMKARALGYAATAAMRHDNRWYQLLRRARMGGKAGLYAYEVQGPLSRFVTSYQNKYGKETYEWMKRKDAKIEELKARYAVLATELYGRQFALERFNNEGDYERHLRIGNQWARGIAGFDHRRMGLVHDAPQPRMVNIRDVQYGRKKKGVEKFMEEKKRTGFFARAAAKHKEDQEMEKWRASTAKILADQRARKAGVKKAAPAARAKRAKPKRHKRHKINHGQYDTQTLREAHERAMFNGMTHDDMDAFDPGDDRAQAMDVAEWSGYMDGGPIPHTLALEMSKKRKANDFGADNDDLSDLDDI